SDSKAFNLSRLLRRGAAERHCIAVARDVQGKVALKQAEECIGVSRAEMAADAELAERRILQAETQTGLTFDLDQSVAKPTLYLFPDTNVCIQCKALHEVDWKLLGDFDEIVLLICRAVQDEIDQQKGRGAGRVTDQARTTPGMFRSM